MTMTEERKRTTGRDPVERLKAAGRFDALFARVDAGRVELTGVMSPDPGIL